MPSAPPPSAVPQVLPYANLPNAPPPSAIPSILPSPSQTGMGSRLSLSQLPAAPPPTAHYRISNSNSPKSPSPTLPPTKLPSNGLQNLSVSPPNFSSDGYKRSFVKLSPILDKSNVK